MKRGKEGRKVLEQALVDVLFFGVYGKKKTFSFALIMEKKRNLSVCVCVCVCVCASFILLAYMP